jgi:hypothetical protein
MILDSTVRSIAFALGEAISASNCDITADYVDITTTTYTPGTNTLVSNGVTKVTPVAAPGSSTQRQVKEIRIHNNDTITHTFILYYDDNGTYRVMDQQLIPPAQSYVYTPTTQFSAVPLAPLPGFLGGLGLSNDSVSPNTVLDIAAGECCSDDSSTMMALTSVFTKTTGTWSSGTGNGGLDTGTIGAGWYHVFVIFDPATGASDVLFSASATSPTLPSGYTKKRRIGSFEVDGSSHIIAFTQSGDYFYLSTPITNLSSATVGNTTANTLAVQVPSGIVVEAILTVYLVNSGNPSGVYYSALASADLAVNGASGALTFTTGAANQYASGMIQVLTNTSQSIRYRNALSGDVNNVICIGWIDRRGKG